MEVWSGTHGATEETGDPPNGLAPCPPSYRSTLNSINSDSNEYASARTTASAGAPDGRHRGGRQTSDGHSLLRMAVGARPVVDASTS